MFKLCLNSYIKFTAKLIKIFPYKTSSTIVYNPTIKEISPSRNRSSEVYIQEVQELLIGCPTQKNAGENFIKKSLKDLENITN